MLSALTTSLRRDWTFRPRPAAPSRPAACCMCSRSASTISATRRVACISIMPPRTHTTSRARFSTARRAAPGKASLYADVDLTYLPNDKADSAAILDALDAMAQSMAKSEPGQDVAVILGFEPRRDDRGPVLSHPLRLRRGITGQRASKSAVSASEFAKKVGALAAHGKVLLLLTPAIPARSAPRAGRTIPTPKSFRTPWTWKT